MDPDLLARLASPECYAHAPASVEVLQTHISVVCLAGELVFKLKKPVRLPFLDFSTLELRERYCREELRLNRRLCGGIYREVVALCEQDGRLRFGGAGRVVDHAVVMQRLPAAAMLDQRIRDRRATAADVEAVARTMLPFHRAQRIRPGPGEPGDPDLLAEFVRANFTETRALVGTGFEATLHGALEAEAARSLAWLVPRLRARVGRGFTVDGHGDLHARNICATDPPVIYDCIEFSPELRCGDVATENAFLVMDLQHRGRADLGRAYLDAYLRDTRDEEQRELLPPLVRYRALVRAKVTAFVAADADVPAADRAAAAQSSRQHQHLAAISAIEQGRPLWVLACGLPASGKSTVFAALAGATGWSHVSSDAIRKELAGIAPTAIAPESWYTTAASDRVYRELAIRAASITRTNRQPVLLDATFHRAERRGQIATQAAQCGADLLLVWFDVDDAEARARLRTRPKGISDADLAVYERLRASAEPPGQDEPVLRIRDCSVDTAVDRILAALVGRNS